MKITKQGIEKAAAVVITAATAVQTVLVAQGIERPDLAAGIASGAAAILAAYHGVDSGVTKIANVATVKAEQLYTQPIPTPTPLTVPASTAGLVIDAPLPVIDSTVSPDASTVLS